ncbi:MAG: hypothetical protein WCP20_10040 [Desulfuromonadales bacterium]
MIEIDSQDIQKIASAVCAMLGSGNAVAAFWMDCGSGCTGESINLLSRDSS